LTDPEGYAAIVARWCPSRQRRDGSVHYHWSECGLDRLDASCSRWWSCQGRREAPPPSAVLDPWQDHQREL